MGIRIEEKIIAYDSITCGAIDPSYLGIKKEEIEKYLSENPMPKDGMYTAEDLIHDLTCSEGVYMLPKGIKEETIDYIEELLNDLI
jgi:hypothetical protein